MFLFGIQGFQKRKYQTLKQFKKHLYTSYLVKVTSIMKMQSKFQTWILLNKENLLSTLNLQRKLQNTPNISTGLICKTWRYQTLGKKAQPICRYGRFKKKPIPYMTINAAQPVKSKMAIQGARKWPKGSGKVSSHWFLGAPVNFH